MKTATPKKLAAKPAARRSPRTLWIVGVPAIALLVGLATQSSLFGRKATAAPAEQPVRLQKPVTETVDGFKATNNSHVFVRNAPALAQSAADGNGFIYLKPGADKAGISRASRTAASAVSERAGTSAAGGVCLQMNPGLFPYAQAQLAPNGKTVVKCVEPARGSASQAKSEHSH